jgi:hypothetical protein
MIPVQVAWTLPAAAGLESTPPSARLVTRSGRAEPPVRVVDLTTGGVEISLPSKTLSILTLEAPDLWAPEVPLLPRSPGEVVRIPLLPAGAVAGQLAVPRGEPLPPELALEIESAVAPAEPRRRSRQEPPFPPSSARCPVAEEGRFRCPVPAGRVSLRLGAPGFAGRYLWNLEVPARGVHDLAVVRLEPGGSIVGRVETPDGFPPDGGGRITLLPQSLARAPAAGTRPAARRPYHLLDPHGFFQFRDLAAGAYRLRVEKVGFAPLEVGPIQVHTGRESRLPAPLLLQPPLPFELTVTPPRTPYNTVWFLSLRPLDGDGEKRYPLDDQGRFLLEDLAPGTYSLTLWSGDEDGDERWWWQEVQVAAGSAALHLDLPLIPVAGRLRLGREPLVGEVLLGGAHGARQVRFHTDEEGRFEGYAPRAGRHAVAVRAPEIGLRHLRPVEVREPPAGSSAHLDLVVPDTRILGEVVDSQGRPVERALVHSVALPDAAALDYTWSDEDGRFELRGLPLGPVAVSAQEGAGDAASAAVELELTTNSAVEVRLVLERRQELTGRVTHRGYPVPGARILATPRVTAGAEVIAQPELITGLDGGFRLRLPARSPALDLLVLAPGFAAALRTVPLPARGPLGVEVEPFGATLVLARTALDDAAVPSPLSYWRIGRDGAWATASVLRSWARLHHAPVAPGRLVIPALEPGEYTFCAPRSIVQGDFTERCRSGFLPPGGELVLSVEAGATAATRQAYPTPPPASPRRNTP